MWWEPAEGGTTCGRTASPHGDRKGRRYPSDLSDAEWKPVDPLIPPAKPGGRKRSINVREVLNGIFYVLSTGCQWKALPKSFGSASAVHKHFQRWRQQGFFRALWPAGLAEYDEMEGIAWEWQSIDGTQGKAPLAQEAAGNNPTDRGKKRRPAQPAGGRRWRPAVPYRQRGQPA